MSFAVAQPIYDRLVDRTAFLIDLDLGYGALVGVVVILSLVLPACFVLMEWLVRICGKSAYSVFHLGVMFLLFVLLGLPLVKLFSFLPAPVVCCLAIVAGVVATWSYARFSQIRNVITWAALGIAVFPAMFLAQGMSRLSVSLPGASRAADWNPAPVVMVVFDEFCGSTLMTPDRQIDAVRFPNIAELARHSTWYRNASSVHHMTEFALPSILSGKYGPTTLRPSVGNLPQNLFSVLTMTGGYEQAAFEPISRLARAATLPDITPASQPWQRSQFMATVLGRVYLYHLMPQDFAQFLPPIPMAWFGVLGDPRIDPRQHRGVFRYEWGQRRTSQFEHFLACIDGSSQPTLHFLHLLLPHVPWCYLPSGRRYAEDGESWDLLDLSTHGGQADHWGQDELEVVQSQQRYLLQLMYLDRQVGRLMARLKETGQYDKSLLILTADHGISFRKNEPRRAIAAGSQDEILSIPLFIKRPGQTVGEVSDRIVEEIDIFPSIADVLGIQLHEPCDGRSVFDDAQPERTVQTYSDSGIRTSVSPRVIMDSQSARTLRDRFGDSADPDALFRIGPIPQLVGKPVADLPQLPGPPLDLEMIRYGDVVDEKAAIQVPCLYEGTIRTDVPLAESPVMLAVAINGTLRAITRTYTQAGFLSQWAAMVPESSFHDGKNDVQFYRVTGADPQWQLTPCILHHRPPKPFP